MSRSIDERVVEMKFENSKFESGAKQTMSTLDKLKQSLKLEGAAKGFEEVSSAANNIKMDGIGTACETVKSKFSALEVVAITALANIANDAVNAGKRIVSALTLDGARDGFAEYEEKMGSVQTIMNGTGESLETVMGYLEDLNRYADQTIYSFSDMTNSIGKFTNAGVDLKTSVAAIQGISNAVALSGGAADKASIAMYNFAQALSIGYVGLTDWKSIELSGMATLDFKKTVMDTAVELGTLRKEADGTYKTIEKGVEVTAEGMRESLKQQWFTSDVLTTVLAKYSDQTTELGKRATQAATEVKTFSMMIDTLKEGIGSGWAITFENLIGNFNQATKMFTNATNSIQEVIDAQADARNKFVNDAFNKNGVADIKDWSKLKIAIEGTGASAEKLQEQFIQTARSSGIAIDDMIKEAGGFSESLSKGWLNSEIFNSTVDRITELGNTAPEFKKLSQAITNSSDAVRDLTSSMSQISGRDHVINALTNTVKGLQSVLKPVKEAFRDIFPPKTGEDLRNLLARFDEFTKKLILSDEAAAKVKETFTGFFKVIKMGLEGVRAIAEAFSPLVDIFKILFTNLLQGVGSLGKFFNTLDEGAKSTSLFQTVLNTIHDVLETFANNLQGYIDKIKNGFNTLRDTISQSWDTGVLSIVAEAIERIKEAIERLVTGAGGGLKTFFESLNGSGEKTFLIVNVLTAFADGLKSVWEKLQPLLQPVIDRLKEFFTEFDLIDTLTAGVEAGGISVIVAQIGGFIDTIGDLFTQVNNIADAPGIVNGFIQQLGDTFESLEQNLRVSVVKDFALSVGILAAAIYALGTIDPTKAWNAVGIISLLVGELVLVFNKLKDMRFNSIGKSGFFQSLKDLQAQLMTLANMQSLASILMKMATAILILAAAMKVLSTIDAPALWQSLGVVTILLGELTAVMFALSKFSNGEAAKGGGTMLAMAISLTILAGAMNMLAGISWEDAVKGILIITDLMAELIIAMKLMDGVEASAGSMIAASIALLILAGAMKVYATMEWEEIAKGLVAVGGLLLELGVALTLMEAALPGAAALLVAAPAILILAAALKVLGSIDSDKILPLLGMLGGVLLELTIGLTAMIAALPGAAALLVAAAAIAVLAPALILLSKVPAKDIYKALGELAVALIGFGVIGTVLGVVSPLLLAFSAALLVFGVAIVGIGAGIALAAAGLTALSAAFGILSEVGKESAERFVETLQTILIGIMELAPKMGEALIAGLESMAKRFVEAAPILMTALNTLVSMLITVFTEKIPALANAFWVMLTALQEKAREFLPHIVDVFLEMVTLILQTFNDHLPDLIQAGTDIIVSFIHGVQSAQNQIIDAAMQAMVAFINGLSDSIDAHAPELAEAIRRLFHSMIDAALLVISGGNQDFVVKAHEVMGSFKSGISEKIHEVVDTVRKMVSDCVAGIKEKVKDFRDAAVQLVNGFVEGIKSKISAAKDAVVGLAGDVVANLKSALDIHSPSRVAAEIGSYFGQGFSNGIEKETSNVSSTSKTLANSATEAMNTALSGMSAAVEAKAPEFQALGTKVMTEFSTGIQNGVPNTTESMNTMFNGMVRSLETTNITLQTRFKSIIEMLHAEIVNNYNKFYNEGIEIVNKIILGLKSRDYNLRIQANQLVQTMSIALRNGYSSFYSSGQYLVDGFISGISSKISEAASKAAQMAAAAASAARANLQIHSPSRVFMQIGAYAGEGFIEGLSDYENASGLAGASLAIAAVRAANEMVENDMDMNPVITPVMDLTSVEESTKKLSAMLSRNQALNINTELGTSGTINRSGESSQTQNITFTQNNYSPKALSREEIYRQTNNQISKMRGAFA